MFAQTKRFQYMFYFAINTYMYMYSCLHFNSGNYYQHTIYTNSLFPHLNIHTVRTSRRPKVANYIAGTYQSLFRSRNSEPNLWVESSMYATLRYVAICIVISGVSDTDSRVPYHYIKQGVRDTNSIATTTPNIGWRKP